MINKSLINKSLPYLSKGRWYKFFIEIVDAGYKITSKDIDCSISGTSLKIPGIEIIDVRTRIHSDAVSVQSFDETYKIYADGAQGVNLPPVAACDYFTLWVFGAPAE